MPISVIFKAFVKIWYHFKKYIYEMHYFQNFLNNNATPIRKELFLDQLFYIYCGPI